MLAFRSEASVERWCEETGNPHGYVLELDQMHELGRLWYGDKLSPEWKRATPLEAEVAFARVGLTGHFWRLS
jgi:Alkylmercury lyase